MHEAEANPGRSIPWTGRQSQGDKQIEIEIQIEHITPMSNLK